MTNMEIITRAENIIHDEERWPELSSEDVTTIGAALLIARVRERAANKATEPMTPERFEEICEAVHNGWWQEKVNQGVTDHPDMKPYADLAEATKDYDRATVCRVLDALGIAYRKLQGGGKR